ncbi:hypothetical protein GCM10020254_73080 [Streptomyces goshikiensis]
MHDRDRQVRAEFTQRRGVLGELALHDGEAAVAVERRPSGKEGEEDAAEGVQVGPRVTAFGEELLGRAVLGGPGGGELGRRGEGEGGTEKAGYAEVDDLDTAVRG